MASVQNLSDSLSAVLHNLTLRSEARFLSSIDFICRKYERLSGTVNSDIIDVCSLQIVKNNGYLKKRPKVKFGCHLSTYFDPSSEEISIKERIAEILSCDNSTHGFKELNNGKTELAEEENHLFSTDLHHLNTPRKKSSYCLRKENNKTLHRVKLKKKRFARKAKKHKNLDKKCMSNGKLKKFPSLSAKNVQDFERGKIFELSTNNIGYSLNTLVPHHQSVKRYAYLNSLTTVKKNKQENEKFQTTQETFEQTSVMTERILSRSKIVDENLFLCKTVTEDGSLTSIHKERNITYCILHDEINSSGNEKSLREITSPANKVGYRWKHKTKNSILSNRNNHEIDISCLHNTINQRKASSTGSESKDGSELGIDINHRQVFDEKVQSINDFQTAENSKFNHESIKDDLLSQVLVHKSVRRNSRGNYLTTVEKNKLENMSVQVLKRNSDQSSVKNERKRKLLLRKSTSIESEFGKPALTASNNLFSDDRNETYCIIHDEINRNGIDKSLRNITSSSRRDTQRWKNKAPYENFIFPHKGTHETHTDIDFLQESIKTEKSTSGSKPKEGLELETVTKSHSLSEMVQSTNYFKTAKIFKVGSDNIKNNSLSQGQVHQSVKRNSKRDFTMIRKRQRNESNEIRQNSEEANIMPERKRKLPLRKSLSKDSGFGKTARIGSDTLASDIRNKTYCIKHYEINSINDERSLSKITLAASKVQRLKHNTAYEKYSLSDKNTWEINRNMHCFPESINKRKMAHADMELDEESDNKTNLGNLVPEHQDGKDLVVVRRRMTRSRNTELKEDIEKVKKKLFPPNPVLPKMLDVERTEDDRKSYLKQLTSVKNSVQKCRKVNRVDTCSVDLTNDSVSSVCSEKWQKMCVGNESEEHTLVNSFPQDTGYKNEVQHISYKSVSNSHLTNESRSRISDFNSFTTTEDKNLEKIQLTRTTTNKLLRKTNFCQKLSETNDRSGKTNCPVEKLRRTIDAYVRNDINMKNTNNFLTIGPKTKLI